MRVRTITTAALGGLALGLLAAPPAWAAVYQVTTTAQVNTTADTVDATIGDGTCADAGGACSLRAAIQEANASDGADTITLSQASYVLRLAGAGEDAAATGDLDVTSSIRIAGHGATVNANTLDRAFDVLAGAQLMVDRVAVTRGAPPSGQSGGGYQNVGTLTLTNASVKNSTVAGTGASGGAIVNSAGSLVVRDSSLTGNSAERAGGAIEANAGTTELTRVRLIGNATGPSPGNGGGLHLTGTGSVTVSESTVSGNTATAEGGGLWNSSTGTMSVTGSSVTGNTASGVNPDEGGGGLFNDGGTLSVLTTLVADNEADGLSGSGGGILNNLGTLSVERSWIRSNSAQRAGGGIEANAGSTSVVTTTLDGNATGANPGNGGGLHLTGTGDVQLTRSGIQNNTAAAEGGGLWNSATGTMTATQVSVANNTASGAAADQGGGGLFSDGGALRVTGSSVRNNVADGLSGSGGGILNNLGTLTVDDTIVQGNNAQRAGGGIEANIGTTTVTGSRLTANVTGPNPGNGGGLHLTGAGQVSVSNTSVTGNTATAEGGGLWNSATGTMTVSSALVQDNTASGAAADQGGGGLFNDGGTLSVEDSRVLQNSAAGAAGSGGGMLNNLGTLNVSNTLVDGNDATRAGGGIEANVGTTNVVGGRLSNNTTGANPGNGGGLHLTGAGQVTIDGSQVDHNSATNEGGGLWNSETGTMTVTDTPIFANTAPVGADVYNDGGTFAIDGDPVPVGP